MLDQGAPRHAAGRDDFGQSDRSVEISLDVIDCPFHVARQDRPFQPPQRLGVIMGLMQQQRGRHEFSERPRDHRLRQDRAGPLQFCESEPREAPKAASPALAQTQARREFE